jgi:hypothetical protein
VQLVEQRLGDAPVALGLIGGGGDRTRQIPRPRQRAGLLHIIHRQSRA